MAYEILQHFEILCCHHNKIIQTFMCTFLARFGFGDSDKMTTKDKFQ